jgi:hypothetical protein
VNLTGEKIYIQTDQGMCPISGAVERLAHDSEGDERGAVFTRREVVDFMLDLAGYTRDRPLHTMRLLEPSFGGGEFLLATVERLIAAFQAAGGAGDLGPCIRAVELHSNTFTATRNKLEICFCVLIFPRQKRPAC